MFESGRLCMHSLEERRANLSRSTREKTVDAPRFSSSTTARSCVRSCYFSFGALAIHSEVFFCREGSFLGKVENVSLFQSPGEAGV